MGHKSRVGALCGTTRSSGRTFWDHKIETTHVVRQNNRVGTLCGTNKSSWRTCWDIKNRVGAPNRLFFLKMCANLIFCQKNFCQKMRRLYFFVPKSAPTRFLVPISAPTRFVCPQKCANSSFLSQKVRRLDCSVPQSSPSRFFWSQKVRGLACFSPHKVHLLIRFPKSAPT